jgi:type III restriction enzyme
VNVTGRPIVGEATVYTLEDLKRRRDQEVVFLLAKLVLEKYFRQDGTEKREATPEHKFSNEVQAWLFPQVLKIAKEWYSRYVYCKDNTFPQLLLLIEHAHNAADKIYRAIVASTEGGARLVPILRAWDPIGSTRGVDFDTTRDVYRTDRDRCHVSHVVADSSWESKTAQVLEEMDEVICYVKNQGLGFTIPYTIDGQEHSYMPDFIVHIDDGHGREDPLKLVLEVSGEAKKEKAVKVQTARGLWVPAVNNAGQYGRWSFLEVTDPWDAKNTIRAHVRGATVDGVAPLFRE